MSKHLAVWSFLPCLVAAAVAQNGPADAIGIRLVPLADGLLDLAPRREPTKHADSELGKLAAAVGVDLMQPDHPLVAAKFDGKRLFYVFFKTTENAFGDRAWLLQRIKKTERTWHEGASAPEEKVTWQVEAFKLMNGALKRPDQHHGSFALRGAKRREIVKEYQIGFGELPGVAAGEAWPFALERLFELIQPYQEAKGRFDDVQFTASRTWSLTVAFAADGAWRVASPEFDLDAPRQLPDRKRAEPAADVASSDVVLERGVGALGVRVGVTKAEDLERALGGVLEDVPVGSNSRALSFARSLSANVAADGVLNTLITRPGFAGRTKEGIRHGMTRADVGKLLLRPATVDASPSWVGDGLVVDFDADGRVRRLVITKR